MKKIIYFFLAILIIGCGGDDDSVVEIPDTTAPVITLLGEPNVVLPQNEEYIDAGATAADNVDGDITENIVVIGDVNVSVPDSYTLNYNVSDAAGNTAIISRIVNVIEAIDTIPPVITIIGDANVSVLQFINYIDAGATATDNIDGDITYNIVTTGEVNTVIVGTYTITYTVSDAAGNTTTALKEVTVVENNEANPVYLDENGVTVKAREWAEVGALGQIDGLIYTVVDETMLRVIVENEEDLTQLATTKVTSMSELFGMFSDFNQDISIWDVSSVTDMSFMFRGTRFNQPIGNWDVSNVNDMSSMFENATNFNQDIGDWNVSNVISMDSMFKSAKDFNKPIGNWDVSHVTSMKEMFRGFLCKNACYIFNQPIGDWDVSNVTDMSGMFSQSAAFNQPIGDWDVSNVTDMRAMFSNDLYGNYAFNQPIGNWDVSNVTDMSSMFSGNHNNTQSIVIGDWDVSNVTDMSRMFANCGFNNPIGDWDVSNVTNMVGMFQENIVFNQPIGTWDVSNVTDMSRMFFDAKSFNQPIGNWDVGNVTNMSGMFINWSNFSSTIFNQPLERWNVSNVTNMSSMFSKCEYYNQDLSAWNVSNVLYCGFFDNETPQWTLPKPNFTNCTP